MTDPTQPLADTAAEQIVLGAMMLSTTTADDIIDQLTTNDFYQPKHGTIYAALLANLAAGEPTDPVAIAGTLATAGDLNRIGGAGYLHTLIAAVPIAASATWYARVIADHAVRRRHIEAGIRITQLGRDLGRDIADVINEAQREIHAAATHRDRSNIARFADLIDDVLADLHSDQPQRGLSTGIGALDDVIGGLKPGQLVVIAGRPGMGKSILGVDLARTAAMRRDIPALIYSLEMSHREVMLRILAAESSVDLSKLTDGRTSPFDRGRVTAAADKVNAAPLFIDDTAQSDLASIRATARRVQQRHGLGLVVVDYLQLMTGGGRYDNRVQEVTEISRGLKLLAKELQVPVVAAAQLNRLSEMRTDKRPHLSDLRESGSIEQDADIVILLHRPDYYDRADRPGEIDLIVAKNRNGAQDTVTAAAQLPFARIVDFNVPEPSRDWSAA